MFEELVVECCAPTLAGIKSANAFSCEFCKKCELISALRKLNFKLREKGVIAIPLNFNQNRALIYLYRPFLVKAELMNKKACDILCGCGYPNADFKCCIKCLKNRLSDRQEFPHELGLFLGYPPDDVLGFIQNRAKNYKCAGCWKVYSDVENSIKLFEKYKKCREQLILRYKRGVSIEELCVKKRICA